MPFQRQIIKAVAPRAWAGSEAAVGPDELAGPGGRRGRMGSRGREVGDLPLELAQDPGRAGADG